MTGRRWRLQSQRRQRRRGGRPAARCASAGGWVVGREGQRGAEGVCGCGGCTACSGVSVRQRQPCHATHSGAAEAPATSICYFRSTGSVTPDRNGCNPEYLQGHHARHIHVRAKGPLLPVRLLHHGGHLTLESVEQEHLRSRETAETGTVDHSGDRPGPALCQGCWTLLC